MKRKLKMKKSKYMSKMKKGGSTKKTKYMSKGGALRRKSGGRAK